MRARPKIEWDKTIDLSDYDPGCLAVCEHIEDYYRMGYRDGWLAAIDTFWRLHRRERRCFRGGYLRLWNFWNTSLARWRNQLPMHRGAPPRVKIIPTDSIDRKGVWVASEGICGICGKAVALRDMEIDHILPWSRGGSNEATNLQASHKSCNRAKGTREDD